MKDIKIGLVIELVRRDFLEKFSGSVLGSLWSFLWPLINILVYVLIFSNLMQARLAGIESKYSYSIYLIAGILPWTTFSTTVLRSCTIFTDKKNILSKIKVALPSMPLYVTLSESIIFIISLMFYYLFLIGIGHSFSIYHLLIPFIILLQQLLAFGLGLVFAIFTVFIRDLKELIGIIFQVWFWFTPIVYVADILPDTMKKLLAFNPIFVIVDSFQKIFVWNQLPDIRNLIFLSFISIALLVIAHFLFIKLEKDVKDFI